MIELLKQNFPTFAMLLALNCVTVAVVALILSGKCQGSDVVIVALCSAVTGLAGAIGGYSMHKTADSSVQADGINVSKTVTGA